ncbi:Uma2 family endonuclease [Planktothricoides raciborskii]|uniref:Uma2 family endonuclease n=1 Tax=Planktothricoides raciborskii GIHE-MW2 TaxID=2792601 RepID=A0AAU8JG66_9CYAN
MTITAPTLTPTVPGRVVLNQISWHTYEQLLAEMEDNRTIRLCYDRGLLEIMTPLLDHENPKEILTALVGVLAEELNIEIMRAGSTTLKRPDLAKGAEPDSSFYIQNERLVKGKSRIDLTTDPPPDLVIEIYVSSSSVDREGIYAAMGVPEIWRCDRGVVKFLQLEAGKYIMVERSLAFPLLSVTELTKFFSQSQTLGETTLLRSFRAWVRQVLAESNSETSN